MALPPDVIPLVRNFANNSYRYLFRQPDNVADLVRWQAPTIASCIDFTRLQVQPDTFISPGFSELESDLLLRAPWLDASQKSLNVQVFILIEHQSEPDRHAIFRICRYLIQVYDRQEKHWLQTHGNTRDLTFDPVLPIVFYSGSRTWEQISPMHDLVHHGHLFVPHVPTLSPVFINLQQTTPEVLQGQVGTFGWVLWLVQQQRRSEPEFREALRQVVSQVEQLHGAARGRWEHLLWFAHALVYHARNEIEREPLAQYIRSTVRRTKQPEVGHMDKTIAEALREEGAIAGALASKREMLLIQLRLKFKRIPRAIVAEIEAAEGEQLDAWIAAFATAESLSDIPFQAGNK